MKAFAIAALSAMLIMSTLSALPVSAATDTYDSAILTASQKHGFAYPLLIKAQVIVASAAKPDAVGSTNPCGIPKGWTEYESRAFGLLQSTPACNGLFLKSDGHPNLSQSDGIFNPTHHLDITVKQLVTKYLSYYKQKFAGCSAQTYAQMAVAGWGGGLYSVYGCGAYSEKAQSYLSKVLAVHQTLEPLNPAPASVDRFGVAKIYETKDKEWYVNMADPRSDSRFKNLPSMTRNSDGSWQVSASQVRMEAWSPSGSKWQNVEITGYVKMHSGSELVQLYSRGGHHFSDPDRSCDGSAYKARFYGSGNTAWVKEVNHPAYTSNRGSVDASSEEYTDRWVGVKAVIYNVIENGNTHVRLETYLDDTNTNTWKPGSVYVDRGGWETTNSDFDSSCPSLDVDSGSQYRQRDEILSKPGGTDSANLAAWRSDGLTWSWKNLSVREIDPGRKLVGDDTSELRQVSAEEMHGVNYMDPVLSRKQWRGPASVNYEFVDKHVEIAAENDWNILRVPLYWEAYEGNSERFIDQAAYIADKAGQHGIQVFFENHHYFATSNWGCDAHRNGAGFPASMTINYSPQGDSDCRTESYGADPEIRAFWDDWWGNEVRGVDDAWERQADFFREVVYAVDHYPNVIGYELFNEPHVWEDSDYDDLGAYHTRMARELREATDKTIIFTRETAHGGYDRSPSLEYKILPLDPENNLMYWPHLYRTLETERGTDHIERFKQFQAQWADMGYDVGIGIGEFAVQDNQHPDLEQMSDEQGQKLMDMFISTWAKEKWPHTYWTLGCYMCGEGNVLADENGLTRYARWYSNAITKYYN